MGRVVSAPSESRTVSASNANGVMRGIVVLGVVLGVSGCAWNRTSRHAGATNGPVPAQAPNQGERTEQAGTPEEGPGDVDAFPTLLVENTSGYQITVYLGGRRLGTATRGRRCLRMPQMAGELRLTFVAHDGRGYRAPIAFLEESRHWRVEFRPGVTIKYDVLSLKPRRSACRG